MFLFSKKAKEQCSICHENESFKVLSDGCVCKQCLEKCNLFILPLSAWGKLTVEDINTAISAQEKNQYLESIFSKTDEVERYIQIDSKNMLMKASAVPGIVFSLDELVSYELVENGQVKTKGGLGSAVVGGALFGAAGAVVGSIVGKKQIQEVTEYKIKFVTTHPYKKMFYIDLLKGMKTKTDSFIYKTNQTLAENIIALIASTKASSEKSTNNMQQSSAADELLKFKELLDCGAITQEEFDQKKKQLLGV